MKNATNLDGEGRTDYVRFMKEVGNPSLNFLNNYLKDNIKDNNLLKTVSLFLLRRKDAVIRPFIVKNSWAYFSEHANNIGEIIPLASVAELENISQYQSNAVYDNKYIINSEKDKTLQIIASFLTRDFVDNLLFENYDKDIAITLSCIFRKIDYYNQLGQFDELDKLFYGDEYNFDDIGLYTKTYLRKAMYYGGVWIAGLIISGAIVGLKGMSNDDDNLRSLVKFGILCGTASNLINDLSDYALFEKEEDKFGMHYKKPQDQFKDIENRKILLPFFYTIHSSKKKNNSDYNKLLSFIGKPLSQNDKEDVFYLIKKYNGLSFAYSVAHLLNKRAIHEINKVKETNSEEVKMFKIMSSLVESNKFIHYYRSKDSVKRVTLNPKIKKMVQFEFFSSGGIANGTASDLLKI